MRILPPALCLTLAATFGLTFVTAQGPVNQLVWAPKVGTLNEWTPPHKPHTKLTDLLAARRGQTDWVQTIVDDDTLHADYISMGPGKKMPRRMNADTREWWVIQSGQIRFTIDGVENKGHYHEESPEFWFILLGKIRYTIEGLPTFVADQGDIVYVPKQRYHLASFAGDGMACRLAMNGYPDLAHAFDASAGGRGQ